MTLANKGTFNLWSQSLPTMKWFTVNGPVFLHLYYDVINDHQERFICLYMYGNNFVNRWYFFHQFVLLNMPEVMKKARSASLKSIFTYSAVRVAEDKDINK